MTVPTDMAGEECRPHLTMPEMERGYPVLLVTNDGVVHFESLDALSRAVLANREWVCAAFAVDCVERSVRDVRHCVVALARSLSFSQEELECIETAVGEAVLNAVRHGQCTPGPGCINVRCVNEPDRIVIDITDKGPGFDPDIVPAPVAENLKVSGYGICLMRGMMDRVVFTNAPDGGANVQMMKLKGAKS